MSYRRAQAFLALLLALLISACASTDVGHLSRKEHSQLEAALTAHIATLASDEYQGRKPGTRGESLTLDYLRNEFEKIGFESGTNDPGSPWLAPVALVRGSPKDQKVSFTVGRRKVVLQGGQVIASTDRRRQLLDNAEVLFIGNLNNEFAQEAVRGRVVLSLGESTDRAKEDKLFEDGAAAVVTVVGGEGDIAALRQRAQRERYDLLGDEDGDLSVHITEAAIVSALGAKTWEGLVGKAGGPDFAPEILAARINIETSRQVRQLRTNNFIARLPGRIPGSGAIVLMGHWDHLGICRDEPAPDRICNGAVDNASGLALMIELGKRLAKDGPFDRDIYVLATTGEEMGLLGAKAFVDAPPMPLDSIIAAFNFDTVAVAPDGKTVGFIGQGATTLDPVIIATLYKMKRKLAPKELADQFLRRQDGWVLLNRDVPAVTLSSMMASEEISRSFMATHYHQPSDEAKSLVLGGAIDDLMLHEVLVRRLATVAQYPGPNQQSH